MAGTVRLGRHHRHPTRFDRPDDEDLPSGANIHRDWSVGKFIDDLYGEGSVGQDAGRGGAAEYGGFGDAVGQR